MNTSSRLRRARRSRPTKGAPQCFAHRLDAETVLAYRRSSGLNLGPVQRKPLNLDASS